MRKSGFCRPERARPDSEGTEAEAPIGKSEDRHTALRGPLVPLQKQNGPRQQMWKRPSRSSTRTGSLAQGPPARPQLPRGDADPPPPQEKSGGARPAGALRPRKRSAGTDDVNGHSAKKKNNNNKTIVKKKKKNNHQKSWIHFCFSPSSFYFWSKYKSTELERSRREKNSAPLSGGHE